MDQWKVQYILWQNVIKLSLINIILQTLRLGSKFILTYNIIIVITQLVTAFDYK